MICVLVTIRLHTFDPQTISIIFYTSLSMNEYCYKKHFRTITLCEGTPVNPS